jgi:hypothetical protein
MTRIHPHPRRIRVVRGRRSKRGKSFVENGEPGRNRTVNPQIKVPSRPRKQAKS